MQIMVYNSLGSGISLKLLTKKLVPVNIEMIEGNATHEISHSFRYRH